MDLTNFVCCICRKIPSSVAESGCCHSLFCWDCVLGLRGPCPSCGKALDPAECTENRAIEKLIEKLPVKCKYDGCVHSAPRVGIEVHESECTFAVVACPNSELCGLLTKRELPVHGRECVYRKVQCHSCEESLPLNELQSHLELYCSGVVVPCPQLCETILKRSQLAAHFEGECPNALVGCPFAIHGCEQVVMRSQLEAHLHDDASKHLLMTVSLVERQQRELDQLRAQVRELQSVPAAPVLNVEQIQQLVYSWVSDFQPMLDNIMVDVRARLRWATLFWAILILVGLASIPALVRWIILCIWFARGYKVYVKPFRWELYRRGNGAHHVKIVKTVYLAGCVLVSLFMLCLLG